MSIELYGINLRLSFESPLSYHYETLKVLLRLEPNPSRNYCFQIKSVNLSNTVFHVQCQLGGRWTDQNSFLVISLVAEKDKVIFTQVLPHHWIVEARESLKRGSLVSNSIPCESVSLQVEKLGALIGSSRLPREIKRKSTVLIDFETWLKINGFSHCTFENKKKMPYISAFALVERCNKASFAFSGHHRGELIGPWLFDWNVCLVMANRLAPEVSVKKKFELALEFLTANVSCPRPMPRHATFSFFSMWRDTLDRAITKLVFAYMLLYFPCLMSTKLQRDIWRMRKQCHPGLIIKKSGICSFALLNKDICPEEDAFLWYENGRVCCVVKSSRFDLEYKALVDASWNTLCINEPEIVRPLLCTGAIDDNPNQPWHKGFVVFPRSQWEADHLTSSVIDPPNCIIQEFRSSF